MNLDQVFWAALHHDLEKQAEGMRSQYASCRFAKTTKQMHRPVSFEGWELKVVLQ